MDVTVAGVAVDGVAVVGVDDDYEQSVFFFCGKSVISCDGGS